MKSDNKPIEDADLHAYVDGELDQHKREEVEAWLAKNPEDSQRVEDYQKQNQAMHAMFDPVLSDSVPDELVSINNAQLTAYHKQSPFLRIAAIISYMFVGGVIGYAVNDQVPVTSDIHIMTSLPRQAAMAHVVYTPEVVHPVEVSADQETHLAKWLSKRLGTDLRVPHLTPLGYDLVGGRLLPGEEGAAAQFMYENLQGKRLTLYIKNVKDNVAETAFRYNLQGNVSIFYWVDGPLGYALSGEIEKSGLLKAANEVYRTLNL